jgi:hypothetical protein
MDISKVISTEQAHTVSAVIMLMMCELGTKLQSCSEDEKAGITYAKEYLENQYFLLDDFLSD